MVRLSFFAKRIRNELQLFIQVYTVCNCKYLLYQSFPYIPTIDLIAWWASVQISSIFKSKWSLKFFIPFTNQWTSSFVDLNLT